MQLYPTENYCCRIMIVVRLDLYFDLQHFLIEAFITVIDEKRGGKGNISDPEELINANSPNLLCGPVSTF